MDAGGLRHCELRRGDLLVSAAHCNQPEHAADGAVGRTDPNDSVSVTERARARRPTRTRCVPAGDPDDPADLFVVQAHLNPVSHQSDSSRWPLVRVKRDAEGDGERLQRAQQSGDVERAQGGLHATEREPVAGVRLRELVLRDAPRLAHRADRVADIARLAHLDRLGLMTTSDLREDIHTSLGVRKSPDRSLCEYSDTRESESVCDGAPVWVSAWPAPRSQAATCLIPMRRPRLPRRSWEVCWVAT